MCALLSLSIKPGKCTVIAKYVQLTDSKLQLVFRLILCGLVIYHLVDLLASRNILDTYRNESSKAADASVHC